MQYITHYPSPLGEILLASDGKALIGLWFKDQKHFALTLESKKETREENNLPVFHLAIQWLNIYFDGIKPDFSVPVHCSGTPFQQEVWHILQTIPYGQTITYKDIASRIAAERGIPHMSAQATGGAVSRNPVSILIPCHRVIGTDGSLTGYAGGIDRKKALLLLEQGISIPSSEAHKWTDSY